MTSRTNVPDHLISLPGEERWALWRVVALRGAGFPVEGVLRLADAACAAAADAVAAADVDVEAKRQEVLAVLRREIAASAEDAREILYRALKKAKRHQLPDPSGLPAAAVEALAAWRGARDQAAAERVRYAAEFEAAEERVAEALRETAGDRRFREAVLWQNRHAVQTGLAAFQRRAPGRPDSRDRGHARLIASYLQRYSVKNDTIGFFGPIGVAHLVDGEEVITVRPGAELLDRRQVFFEGWAIDALADRMAEDPAMRPWLAPRLSPFLRREGNAWVAPGGQKIELGPLSSALLAGCDGTRSARQLLRSVAETAGSALTPDQEATLLGILADLEAKGVLRWAFQIPMSHHPEQTLRELLLAIEDGPLRERSLATLDEIVRQRDAVERAAGDPEALDRALADLDATFLRLTGRASATRAEGKLYAGRTLVFEECRRDLELQLGRPFLADLAPALSVVLDAARWFTQHLAADHREVFRQVHAELSARTGSTTVSLLAFTQVAMPRVVSRASHEKLQQELFARWGRVLAVPPGTRRVQLRSADLRPLVDREFAAPGPGWQKARIHSPDLLIAAPSVEAIRRGDYLAVLGETHVAVNTLDRNAFFSQHPHPEQLSSFIESDLPEPSLIPVFPKVWNQEEANAGLGVWAPAASPRMDVALRSAKDFYLDLSLDPPRVPAGQLLPIGDLVVEPAADQLVVRPRDGRVSFEIIDFYQLVMLIQTVSMFRVLPEGSYTPRVTIDRLVVVRESWIVPAAEIDFAAAASAAERFAGARLWAGKRGLPRFLFVKTPGEAKPFYVDLQSPLLVESFAHAVRKIQERGEGPSEILLSEMLPDHDASWLPDAAGHRYTCELRLVAVDQA
ncbi:MAG TPA: hypothetical protein DD490_30215 [Acidobacteria bacterium]|nr:hypothetical protein [Acidobacteriota bacterium]